MKTIEEAYNDLVSKNHSWVNPELRRFDNPAFVQSHFIVCLVDFEEISSIPCVRIVYMRKWSSAIMGKVYFVYCELL